VALRTFEQAALELRSKWYPIASEGWCPARHWLGGGCRFEGELTAFNAAADAALALGRPLDKVNDTARMLIDWAAKAQCD